MSETPITGSDDQRVVSKSLVLYSVDAHLDWDFRHSFEKWLAKNGQAVIGGHPLAEVLSTGPKGSMVNLIRAPIAGRFFRSPQISTGTLMGERNYSIGQIQVTVPADEDIPNLSPDLPTKQALRNAIIAHNSALGRASATHSAHEPPVREPPQEIRAAMAAPTTDCHGVFISYRRSDQAAFAGRLYDRLVQAFDKSTIFMDVDSIDLGLDFVDVLRDALAKCKVVIVVIGREWLSAADEDGELRLGNPDDFVRLEVEVALERGLRVIPVLVDGAPMPRSTNLPDSMAKLARRNGREISNARFGSDTIELINTLRKILED